MRATPSCTRRLQEDLKQLKQKEDLELLRAPLIRYGLFPPDKDPDTAQITAEELKKLVRYWKLHETRAFWKMHPLKEDLIRALLTHISDKEDSLGFPVSTAKPRPPASPKPSKQLRSPRAMPPPASATDTETFDIGLRGYIGDLFGRTVCTGGMVYLSRVQHKGYDEQAPGATGSFESTKKETKSQRPPLSVLTQGLQTATLDDDDPQPNTANTVTSCDDDGNPVPRAMTTHKEPQRDKTWDIAVKFYKFSLIVGKEQDILREGVLGALRDMMQTPKPQLLGYTGATLCNLSYQSGVTETLLGSGFAVEATRFVMNSGGNLQLCWAYLLLRMSECRGYEDKLVPAAMHATDSFQADDATVSDVFLATKLSVALLANLARTDERENIMGKLKEISRNLVRSKDEDSWLVLMTGVYNLALQEPILPILIDSGAVIICHDLLREVCTADPNSDRGCLIRNLMARTMYNLTCSSDTRRLMLKDGATWILARLVDLKPTDKEAEYCAAALMNLTNPNPTALKLEVNLPHHEVLVINGGVDALVKLCDQLTEPSALLSIASALLRLSSSEPIVGKLCEQQTHTTLLRLLQSPQANGKLVACCVSALCNLLVAECNHVPLVESGLMDALTQVVHGNADLETKGLCIKTISNLSPSLQKFPLTVHSQMLQCFSKMASASRGDGGLHETITAICVAGFAGFSAFSSLEVLNEMLTFDVPRRVVSIIEAAEATSKMVFPCTACLDNLARHPDFHDELYRQGCVVALSQLAQNADGDALFRCASTLKSLCRTPKEANGLITALASLQRNASDQATLKVTAEALFILSCDQRCLALLSAHTVILKQLFGIMRGGVPDTQLCSARALCNLATLPVCATTILDNAIVDDFVVISILRTNNDKQDVKAVCAYILFNLMHADQNREQMIAKDVLWAVVKLAKIESDNTKRVAMKVLFNLACVVESRREVMNLGVGHVLGVLGKQQEGEAADWAAKTMLNLSWDRTHATELVRDGAVGVLRELATRSKLTKTFAHALYNMSSCGDDTLEKMAQEGAAVLACSLLVACEGQEDQLDVVQLCCLVLFNFTQCKACRHILSEHQVTDHMIELINEQSNWREGHLVLILSAILHMSTAVEDAVLLVNAGASHTCVLFAAHETKEVRELAYRITSRLCAVREGHARLAADNVMPAIKSMLVAQEAGLDDDVRVCSAVLSESPACSTYLVESAVLEVLIELMQRHRANHEQIVALVLRNLTCSVEGRKAMCRQEEHIVNLVDLLSSNPHERLYANLSIACYNLVKSSSCTDRLKLRLQPILTHMYNECTDDGHRQVCGLSLVATQAANKDEKTYTTGSVLALIESLQATEGRDMAMDRGIARLSDAERALATVSDHVASFFPVSSSQPRRASCTDITREIDEPGWVPIPQDVTLLQDAAESQAAVSAVQEYRCVPPRSSSSHPEGDMVKVHGRPCKVTIKGTESREPALQKRDVQAESGQLDFVFNLEIDVEATSRYVRTDRSDKGT